MIHIDIWFILTYDSHWYIFHINIWLTLTLIHILAYDLHYANVSHSDNRFTYCIWLTFWKNICILKNYSHYEIWFTSRHMIHILIWLILWHMIHILHIYHIRKNDLHSDIWLFTLTYYSHWHIIHIDIWFKLNMFYILNIFNILTYYSRPAYVYIWFIFWLIIHILTCDLSFAYEWNSDIWFTFTYY